MDSQKARLISSEIKLRQQLKDRDDQIMSLKEKLAISKHISDKYKDILEIFISQGAQEIGRLAAASWAVRELNKTNE